VANTKRPTRGAAITDVRCLDAPSAGEMRKAARERKREREKERERERERERRQLDPFWPEALLVV
jgi:hypothetical protein